MMFKRKDAFTLVELLAVIIILGIILVLAVPRVNDMISKYRDKAYERQRDLIIKAAEIYVVLYEDEIEWDGDKAYIKLKHLQDKDLLPKIIKNPKGGEFNSNEVVIILTKDENGSIKYALRIGKHYSDEELQNMIAQGYVPVASADDLYNIRNSSIIGFAIGTDWECTNCSGGLDKSYVQVTDISLSAYGINFNNGKGWEPIGDWSNKFIGIYDGNNYKITNLYINGGEGFFYEAQNAEFKNIVLENINVTGAYGAVGGLIREITNCKISNSHVTGNISGDYDVGGLVGHLSGNESIITNSSFIGNVSGEYDVGGLVGYLFVWSASESVISNSYASGSVSGTDECIGGLVGCGCGTIIHCYYDGLVEGYDSVGGLVGEDYSSNGFISNSYASGSVSGKDVVGGLVGITDETTIINSYAVSEVTGEDDTGGLIGWDSGGSIVTNSYWDTDTSGQSTSDGGEGRTTSEMKQQTTFVDWDFNTIWQIQENITYPYFR